MLAKDAEVQGESYPNVEVQQEPMRKWKSRRDQGKDRLGEGTDCASLVAVDA